MTATTTNKITVTYWIGTNQHTATAKNYRGAMRIASRNQNAYGPRFYDANGNYVASAAIPGSDPDDRV